MPPARRRFRAAALVHALKPLAMHGMAREMRLIARHCGSVQHMHSEAGFGKSRQLAALNALSVGYLCACNAKSIMATLSSALPSKIVPLLLGPQVEEPMNPHRTCQTCEA